MAYHGKEPSSSEIRHDWLSDRWVIFAPQRNERPNDFAEYRPRIVVDASDCPFCLGHEGDTPQSVAIYPCPQGTSTESSDWQVRVVPNKFPAVNGAVALRWHPVGNELSSLVLAKSASKSQIGASAGNEREHGTIDLYGRRHVTGGHEVIIESPRHLQSISQLDPLGVELVFRAYRDRLRYWRTCSDIAYAVLFKNVGSEAGASLVHSHSQLIATNIIPTDVQRTSERMELFHRTQNECLFCRMIYDEQSEQARIVASSPRFLAFCPFASRFPSQVTVLPKQHSSAFEDLPDSSLGELGNMMHTIVRSIESCYPETSYNYIIHSVPSGIRNFDPFHWRIELFPRLTKVAGFEWGSDCYINPLPPEIAASKLRGCIG